MLTCARILLTLLFSSTSFAVSSLQWDTLSSEFLTLNEVVPVDRTWFRMQAGESTALGYDAGLQFQDHVPKECRWANFKLQNPSLEISVLTAKYLQTCETQLRNESWGWWEDYYRTMFVRIKISEHPYMKRVLLRLPNGYQQPGLLALKDSKTRRPLIIFRAGIFGNSVDIQAERHLIMQLFEQGPFNLLFLDSATSPETVKWNVRYTAGGLDEGLQNYQIAERLTREREPLSQLIEGIHFLGLSMGGHSLWMTLALNEVNKSVVKSALAICPLVQFEKTFNKHKSNVFMNLWAYFRLSLLRDRVGGLTMFNFLSDSFQSVSQGYKGPITDDAKVVFPVAEGFRKDDYFMGNNLIPLLKSIRVPVTAFFAMQETLVPYDLNFEFLKKETTAIPNFHLFSLPKGFHCTFPGAYDWDQFSAMVRDQFLAREPELEKKYHQISQFLPVPADEIPDDPVLRVRATVGDQDLEVSFLSRGGTTVFSRVALQKLDWATAERIRSETEARALIRWARTNISLEKNPSPKLTWKNLKASP